MYAIQYVFSSDFIRIADICQGHLIAMVVYLRQICKMPGKITVIHRAVFIVFPGVSHIGIMIRTMEISIFFYDKIRAPTTDTTAKFKLTCCQIRKGQLCICLTLCFRFCF